MSAYKKIKNTTMQGLEVIVRKAGGGFDHVWLPSKGSVVVNAENITDLVRVAEQRKMLKVTNA
tara:strand:+ start:10729 stop:10917 length:189 start_codon:yes stop_codon:yes gene_type:complete